MGSKCLSLMCRSILNNTLLPSNEVNSSVNNAERDVYFHGLIDLTVISNGENEQDILHCCIKTDNVISSGKVNKIVRPDLPQQHNQYLKQCNILYLMTYFFS